MLSALVLLEKYSMATIIEIFPLFVVSDNFFKLLQYRIFYKLAKTVKKFDKLADWVFRLKNNVPDILKVILGC